MYHNSELKGLSHSLSEMCYFWQKKHGNCYGCNFVQNDFWVTNLNIFMDETFISGVYLLKKLKGFAFFWRYTPQANLEKSPIWAKYVKFFEISLQNQRFLTTKPLQTWEKILFIAKNNYLTCFWGIWKLLTCFEWFSRWE